MKHRGSTFHYSKRLATFLALWFFFPAVVFSDQHGDRIESVHFRDLHRNGPVKITGHFNLPIGQTVTLEGVRAKPSKLSNASTLFVHSVNNVEIPIDGPKKWPQLIQISNIHELPNRSTIILEGYEFVVWNGSADKNWHIDVEFMVTKVIQPGSLELDFESP